MAAQPATERWHVSSIRLRCFKSFGADATTLEVPSSHVVAIVGPNGSGKSALLEALGFVAGWRADALRVTTLKELCSTSAPNQLCEVEVQLSSSVAGRQGGRKAQAKRQHMVRAALTPDGSRAFQVDGRARTGAQVKVRGGVRAPWHRTLPQRAPADSALPHGDLGSGVPAGAGRAAGQPQRRHPPGGRDAPGRPQQPRVHQGGAGGGQWLGQVRFKSAPTSRARRRTSGLIAATCKEHAGGGRRRPGRAWSSRRRARP